MTRFLRLPQVCDRTGFGRTTIYRKMADGEFPRQVFLGARTVAWIEAEVDQWLEQRIEISRSQTAVERA